MRAVSETISTIIIYSVLVALALFMSIYVLHSATSGVASTEYFYVRQLFQSSAQNIPEIVNPLSGGTYTISYPGIRMGIGWMSYGSITLVINNTVEYKLPCTAIYSKIDTAIITSRKIVYGVDELIVNDTRLMPRVVEYYHEGSTYIRLDTCRILLYKTRILRGNTTVYYVRVFFINITPIASFKEYGRIHTLRYYFSSTPRLMSFDNVMGLNIRFNQEGNITEVNYKDLGLEVPIYLDVIIYNLGVEMT